MEIVKDFEFKERGARGKYGELYKRFLEIPHETVVKFSKGADFEVEANQFAISLRTGLWNKGFRARVAVKGDDVFAMILGPRDKGADAESVEESEARRLAPPRGAAKGAVPGGQAG